MEPAQTRRPRQAAARSVPERSPDYAHLSLAGLRAYRKALTAEESRVSYWRRIIQARLDVIRGGDKVHLADAENLRPLLAQAQSTSGRTALMDVLRVDDIPPLPDLAELWDRYPAPGGAPANPELMNDLEVAEAQLSAYRAALHERLTGATGELIARYREDPTQCLDSLPLQAPASPRRR